MPNFILEKRFEINGRHINCKVTGEPGSVDDGSTYVLEINGGPGQNMNTRISEYLSKYNPNNLKHHWIIFDNLGCGDSDKANNPNEEYTPENFTNIAASVVEAVFQELKLNHMNLRVEGGSFGGTIALNIPFHRPKWTQEDSAIRLQSIFAFIAPIGLTDCMDKEFAKAIYADDPKLPEYLKVIDRLFVADINDREDYISNILIPLAPIYGDQYQTLLMRSLMSLVKKHPYSLHGPLNFLKHIKPCYAFAEKTSDFLYNFAFDVTNQFFKDRWHGFELEEKFKQHPEIIEVYNRVSIFVVYGKTDICTSGEKTLIRLRNLLPQIGSYLHPGKHHDNYDIILPLMSGFLSGNSNEFKEVIKGKEGIIIPQTFQYMYMANHLQCYPEELYIDL